MDYLEMGVIKKSAYHGGMLAMNRSINAVLLLYAFLSGYLTNLHVRFRYSITIA